MQKAKMILAGLGLMALFLGCNEAKEKATLPEQGFIWKENAGGYRELMYHGHRLLWYMNGYDPSTEASLLETYKPYHQIFDEKGEHPLTKGPGGLYTHHRGLFIGWNRLTFEGREYDSWHMKGVTQKHEKILEETGGEVQARSKCLIQWIDDQGEPIIEEEREITVFPPTQNTFLFLDFRTRLGAVGGDVFLNGDPEHGGFQFRAHNDVAEGIEEHKAVYHFHKDGIDPKEDQDLPWAAMTFRLEGRRYTVQHLNNPDNPRPTVYSAYRDYGRFGAFFTKKIKAGETLVLRYRIIIVEGDIPTRDEMQARYQAFAEAP